jgi:hypothetical protein
MEEKIEEAAKNIAVNISQTQKG